jgi:hypothetical protein
MLRALHVKVNSTSGYEREWHDQRTGSLRNSIEASFQSIQLVHQSLETRARLSNSGKCHTVILERLSIPLQVSQDA